MSAALAAPGARPAARAARAPALIRRLGLLEYESTWRAMQRFTAERTAATPDEIWFLEHPPVFTLGLNASRAHLLAPGEIPVVQIDRGGQVTYHGPGQLVVYPLIDLQARGPRRARFRHGARARGDRAGGRLPHPCRVPARRARACTSAQRKLASVGVRVRRQGSYHGLALNVALDLEPFARINPCGYAGLQMTQLAALGGPAAVAEAAQRLEPHLLAALGLAA